jgi:hypothetical protein
VQQHLGAGRCRHFGGAEAPARALDALDARVPCMSSGTSLAWRHARAAVHGPRGCGLRFGGLKPAIGNIWYSFGLHLCPARNSPARGKQASPPTNATNNEQPPPAPPPVCNIQIAMQCNANQQSGPLAASHWDLGWREPRWDTRSVVSNSSTPLKNEEVQVGSMRSKNK